MLLEALSIIEKVRNTDLKIMIGCMTETSCAVTAAENISGIADYIDLDGNLLINNDPFDGTKVENGRLKRSKYPGLGFVKLEKYEMNFLDV